jgi:hypothetical protein
MFDRMSNSFALARSSWDVLRRDKKFVLFPILSGLGCLLVMISFAVPMAVVAIRGGIQMQANGQPPWWTYVVAFAFYFCNYFVIVFCNAALVSCALMRFNGQEPTIGDGFRAAGSRMPQIIAWALVSATVGLILKMIENAHEKVGAIISAVLGTGWTVLTFFVVPVLVVEKVGPIDAIKRSFAILRKTWGEALVGNFGLGFFKFLLVVPGFLLVVLGIVLCVAAHLVALGLVVIGGAVLYLMAATAVCATLDTIFLTALYQYAAYEKVPDGFDRRSMEGAFGKKGA